MAMVGATSMTDRHRDHDRSASPHRKEYDMDPTTSSASARDRLDERLRRQEGERADLAAQLLDEQRREASKIVSELHPEVGPRLVEVMEQFEAQVRSDHRSRPHTTGCDTCQAN